MLIRRGTPASSFASKPRSWARPGIELTGFIRSEIGIGQAARLLSGAVESAGLPLTLRDLPIPARAHERGFDAKLEAGVP
ncbi:MAG: hypothetical protein ACKOV8_07995, partial [Phycisphaerales bacterium]